MSTHEKQAAAPRWPANVLEVSGPYLDHVSGHKDAHFPNHVFQPWNWTAIPRGECRPLGLEGVSKALDEEGVELEGEGAHSSSFFSVAAHYSFCCLLGCGSLTSPPSWSRFRSLTLKYAPSLAPQSLAHLSLPLNTLFIFVLTESAAREGFAFLLGGGASLESRGFCPRLPPSFPDIID